jgi:hypothetical protein
MRHAFACVDAQLLAAVERLGGRREHFANPIRGERQVRLRRDVRQPLAAPAGEIGHEHVAPEVQLGREQNDPSGRPLMVERVMNGGEQRSGGIRVRQRGPWERVKVAVEHFGDEWSGTSRKSSYVAPFLSGLVVIAEEL